MLFENNVFKSIIGIEGSNNITFKRNLFLGNSDPSYKWYRVFWLISDTSVTIINNTFSEFDMRAGYESDPCHIIGIM